MVRVNAPLFEWVIENLCKNAVDAIGSSGSIAIKILRGSNNKIFIDITDTGKGISRSNLPLVFKPGFTTKKEDGVWDWPWPNESLKITTTAEFSSSRPKKIRAQLSVFRCPQNLWLTDNNQFHNIG